MSTTKISWPGLLLLAGTTAVAAFVGASCGGTDPAGDDGSDGDTSDGPGAPDADTSPGAPDAGDTPGAPDAATGPGVPDAGVTPPGADAGAAGAVGCTPTSSFLPLPADPSLPGPWPVGARQVKVGRLTVEVFYPAQLGSDAGKAKARYDIRKALPMSEQAKIPDLDNPWQDCDCVKDLPIDASHGPYPVVMFIHGTAGFRTQSLAQVTHWASRGFVVVSADHPGLWLADTLALACFQPQSGTRSIPVDIDAMYAAVTAAAGDLAFLAGRLDLTRTAVVGHSAGASEANGLSNRPGVRVVIAMAGNSATKDSPTLERVLHMAAQDDAVVAYSGSKNGYSSSPGPKRFAGVDNSGHLLFSELCDLKNGGNKNLLQIAQQYNVCGAGLAGGLFDCKPTYIPASVGRPIVNYATSATLEGALLCTDGENAFASMQAKFPQVVELLATP